MRPTNHHCDGLDRETESLIILCIHENASEMENWNEYIFKKSNKLTLSQWVFWELISLFFSFSYCELFKRQKKTE